MVEPIVSIFKEHGFSVWGGSWGDAADDRHNRIDYMHFETPRPLARLLAIMSYEDGKKFFNWHVKHPELMDQWGEEEDQLKSYYEKDPKRFMEIFEENSSIMTLSPTQVLKLLEEKIL